MRIRLVNKELIFIDTLFKCENEISNELMNILEKNDMKWKDVFAFVKESDEYILFVET